MIESIISNKQYETLLKAKKGECIKKVHGGTLNGLLTKRALDEKYNITEIGELLLMAHVKAADLSEEEFKKLGPLRDEVERLRKEAADFYNIKVRAKMVHIEELKREINNIREELVQDMSVLNKKADEYRDYGYAYNRRLPSTHKSHVLDVHFHYSRFKHAAQYIKNGPHRSDIEEI